MPLTRHAYPGAAVMLFADTSFAELVPAIIGAVSGVIGAAGGSLTTLYFTLRTTKRKETQEDEQRKEITLRSVLERVDADRQSMELKYKEAADRLDLVEEDLTYERSLRFLLEAHVQSLESLLRARGEAFRPWVRPEPPTRRPVPPANPQPPAKP